MAAKWWRYNSATHIFEQSLDEGTSWTPPPLHASIITEGVFDPARLGGAIAYTDRDNSFSVHQTFTGNTGTLIHSSAIEIIAGSYPRIGFHWPGVVASSIGMDSAGILRTFNNPGTGYEQFASGTITANGNVNTVGGYFYPGRIDIAGAPLQQIWYLAGHGSYGLYSNTGLFLAGNIWAANVYSTALLSGTHVETTTHIRAATGLYDYARTQPIGSWYQWAVGQGNLWPSAGTITVTSMDYIYMIVGNTVFISFACAASLSVAAANLYLHLPVNATRTAQSTPCSYLHSVGSSQIPCWTHTNAGVNYIAFYCYGGGTFPAGAFNLRGQMFIQF